MFSGIVQTTGQIQWVHKTPTQARLKIAMPDLLVGLQIGASVSVSGVCLTVSAIEGQDVYFDLLEETLKRSSFGQMTEGAWVNLERSVKFGDEIGGHLLSGHIFATATIQNQQYLTDEQCIVTLSCDPSLMKYILPKGYIALNGASLTIVDVDPKGQFTVHLIPETLRITTFGRAKKGDLVNIEIDSHTQAIVTTVERVLENRSAPAGV